MTAIALFTALSAAISTWCWFTPTASGRLRAVRAAARGRTAKQRHVPAGPVVAVALSLTVAVMLGLGAAALTGVVLAVASPRISRWWSSRSQNSQRQALTLQVPTALALMVAAINAGRSPQGGLEAVRKATRGALGAELGRVVERLHASSDPVAVWSQLGDSPLAAVGRAIARAEASGTAVSRALEDVAQELQRDRQRYRSELAERLGVLTTIPMGLCFLPGFMLVTVVPLLLGIIDTQFS
jgi:Flp pilus assembly protein TadB